ncbi:UDP-N-acetylmuramate--L-alanine ligase [Pseudochrobactrum algeriensis]|uniref:UDP-N-acetylmuramate--L-alanine ligase n=1 Tax=Pseudochrobactrum saccharolyticum TaxID=354352 RepID=A0A7W8AMF8_9HYPH|nr:MULTISPECIES: UDP-N-acetylmuramate--L-alanine ligase [Pseudochrobactrum]MBX8784282.1 UDP-N-acetylmuramate--L-alanine ligase [Ochrobactrum sp. GRS2]MBX8811663.1 UDP-N-acetylmuramate--L-alanine ligase [Ochrobactrum sp. MR34]KAB0537688.1 UDP-N-acetylmuramate--L-alanine ligase [Pseudochrobactrum saccharolyticum]MBB5091930.1 UDP-N-acetylmuramate--alanine ligase [Pseudochrobactrum saccharolyticum]MDP8250229.1 UDP-N-acetylmuramate--L-alanine ligase [Pseudochrobactrum saccharolyticum]
MKMPLNIGLVHFIGIGGIGMSGIAEVLHNLGYKVQGSDQADSANVQRLRDKGIEVFVGHKAENIGKADVVVVSTAIRPNNPELVEARENLLPIVRRAEMLAELMRFRQAIAIGGTHGKTTTTSMVATLLEAGHLDPTVINGGIINAYGTNARMGEGEWMVVEADESDGTFLKLPADIAVITNIDPEHLDHYGSFDNVRAAFRQFVENVPFYGFGVMCLDHPEVQALVSRIEDRRVITYGENPQADVRFSNHRMDGAVSVFDVVIRDRKGEVVEIKDLRLPMPGRHNVSNATAAIAVAHELGLTADDIRKGLSGFGGVKRRFTHTGSWNGVEIFDDYGHHPVEIKAVLRAAREAAPKRVIAIAQPHRFTRLASLFDDFSTCFNDADTVMIAPVYTAGEDPIEGVTSEALVSKIKTAGHRDARYLEDPAHLPEAIKALAQEGDFVVFLGAGNITQWAYALPKQLGGTSAA